MSVYQLKSGRWRAQVNRKSVGVYPTKKEARAAEAAFLLARDNPEPEAPTETTVTAWRDTWLSQVASQGRKPSTIRTYTAGTAKFEKAHGTDPLTSWTRARAAEWAAKHPATVQPVGQMFRAAVDLELIERDPFAKAPRPQYRRKLDAGWFTTDDLTRLEATALTAGGPDFGVVLSSMITVAAWTAIRPGELWALRTTDVHAPRLRVHYAIDRTTGKRQAPKSEAGRRTVVLPPAATAAIKRAEAASEYLWPGRLADPDAPLFCNAQGRVWRGPAFAWHWNQIRAAFGRPTMDLYELRHFGITRLIEAGATYEDIAVQVGHSNTTQITRVYGHANAEHARKRLDQVMASIALQAPEPASNLVDASERFAR